MTRERQELLRIKAFILILIVVGQSAIDVYLPSLPSMVHDLSTTATAVRLSLTAFLIGFSSSQLIYGPLSDRFGRKPVLYVGVGIFFISSVICAISPTVEVLFFARLLQGLGMGCGSVISRAMSRDAFVGKELVKISAYVSISWALVPIIAPLIGSYVQHYLGWRYNFVLLALIALMLLVGIRSLLPETHPKARRHSLNALADYKYLLKNKGFVRHIFCVLLIYGIFVDFNIAAPFLLQNKFNLSVIVYGWCIVITACGFILGSVLSKYLINKYSNTTLIRAGIVALVFVSFLMSLLVILKLDNVYTIIIPMFFILGCTGLVYPLFIADSMSPFPKIAGSAGALFGFMVFLGGTLASLIMAHLPEQNSASLAFMIFAQSILILMIYVFVKSEA